MKRVTPLWFVGSFFLLGQCALCLSAELLPSLASKTIQFHEPYWSLFNSRVPKYQPTEVFQRDSRISKVPTCVPRDQNVGTTSQTKQSPDSYMKDMMTSLRSLLSFGISRNVIQNKIDEVLNMNQKQSNTGSRRFRTRLNGRAENPTLVAKGHKNGWTEIAGLQRTGLEPPGQSMSEVAPSIGNGPPFPPPVNNARASNRGMGFQSEVFPATEFTQYSNDRKSQIGTNLGYSRDRHVSGNDLIHESSWSGQGSQSHVPERHHNSNGRMIVLEAMVEAVRAIQRERRLLDASSKKQEIERPGDRTATAELAPIRGVLIEVFYPDGSKFDQEVALSPSLSIYKAIYQAALSYDFGETGGNPFDISIEPDVRRKCYIIQRIADTERKYGSSWTILVIDSSGLTVYSGPCLAPSSKVPLRPGYTIILKYELPT